MEEKNDLYTIQELLEALESIKENGHGDLNFSKAFYCLAKEIQKIKRWLTHHDKKNTT